MKKLEISRLESIEGGQVCNIYLNDPLQYLYCNCGTAYVLRLLASSQIVITVTPGDPRNIVTVNGTNPLIMMCTA
jgi:hypothetical protein